MTAKYQFSPVNKIYLGLVWLLPIGLFLFVEKSPYLIGHLIGQLIGLLLFPALFGWLVWRLRGKKENGGSITFNIVLSLLLLGLLSDITSSFQQAQELKNIAQQRDTYKQAISNAQDIEEHDAAYEKYTQAVQSGMQRMEQSSSGEEKQFYAIMSGFLTDSQDVVKRWNEAYNAVLSPTIFDYNTLTSDAEFERQISVLTNYVSHSREYRDFHAGMMGDLEKRLSVLGADTPLVRETMEGAAKKYNRQKPIFVPLIQAHIKYGDRMRQALEILRDNPGQWELQDKQLLIHSDPILARYNEIMTGIADNENTINTLSTKLVELL